MWAYATGDSNEATLLEKADSLCKAHGLNWSKSFLQCQREFEAAGLSGNAFKLNEAIAPTNDSPMHSHNPQLDCQASSSSSGHTNTAAPPASSGEASGQVLTLKCCFGPAS